MPSLKPRHIVLPLILLVALAFRLYRLLDFPPGFHFDEAIDLKIALDVLGGARPLYVAEGWGREALYYYLVAPMLRLVEYNPLALRATAVLCGLGVLVAAHGLARRLHGQTAAWLTTAWLAVAMWPVWAARFGVRHISLALLLGLAAWAFWWAFRRIRNYELGIRNEEGRVAGGGWRVAHDQRPTTNDQLTTDPLTTDPLTTDLLSTDSLNTDHWSLTTYLPFILAGLLLGLTAYTYQPARFVPLLFGGFAVYLLLFHRRPAADNRMWHNRRGWLVWALSAALVALPLAVIVARVTPIETGERAFSIEPLTELLAGNPRPVLDNLVAVAGVFTVAGDPLKSYNLPGRPLFVPRLTGLFFYAGLALAVWRWRRPAYAFVLLWLVAGLLPTIVTISAPNFNRMVAAQFPIFFLAGVGAAEFVQWVAAWGRPRPSPQPSPEGRGGAEPSPQPSPEGRGGAEPTPQPSPTGREGAEPSPQPSPIGRGSAEPSPQPSPTGREGAEPSPQPSPTGRGGLAALLVVVALGLTAYATARDLFRVWPEQFADAHPLNREIAAVADFLEHAADGRPVVISSRDIEDEDPYVVSVSLDRPIDRRWVDSSQALALPAGAEEAWLIVTADRWVDPLLADVVGLGAGDGEQGGEGALPLPVGEGWGEGPVTSAANPFLQIYQLITCRGGTMRPTLLALQNVVDAALSRPASSGDARAGRDNRRPTFRSLDQVPRADCPAPTRFYFGELQQPAAIIHNGGMNPAAIIDLHNGGMNPAAAISNRLKPVGDTAANPLQRVWFGSRGFQPAVTQPAATQPATISDLFSLHLLTAANWPTLPTPALSLPPESSFAPSYPLPFCACEPGAAAEPALWLTGVEVGAARPGEELTLLTSWQTGPARFLSLALFVHLLDGNGNIVAQDDGLGYPPHTWQPGDRFLQLARLPLPPDLPPGDYTLQFGLYDRATGARWPALNADGQPAGDRVLLMGQQIGD